MIMNGRESVSWDEGETATTVPFEKELLHHKVGLAARGVLFANAPGSQPPPIYGFVDTKRLCFSHRQIPLCPSNSSYEPGDYEYQFTYHLPSALPPTFNVENIYHGPLERLRVEIKYTATAWLTAEGTSVSYLAATQHFVVYLPAAAMAPERPIDECVSENLRLLCCLDRGVCQVKASAAKNIHIAGDALQLQYQICNSSACTISSVRVELIEEITLTEVGNRTGLHIPKLVSSQDFPGVLAGVTTEMQPVTLTLVLPVGESGSSEAMPIRATTTSQHFASNHFVRITCKPFACRSVKLEIPLVVLHRAAANDSFSIQLGSGVGEKLLS